MNILTSEEKERLERELTERTALRKQISERIAEARALGDLKENAEYHAAREDQGMNEAKIRELEKRLASAQVADQSAIPADMVFIGATVRLRDVDSGDEDLYRIVGQSTGDFSVDYIEVTTSSPMGMALMKAKVGETVRVTLPRGERQFLIVELL